MTIWRPKPTRYTTLRDRAEDFFEGVGRFTYRNRLKTLLVMLFITGVVCSQLPTLRVDTSALGLISKHDPIRLEYNKFIDQFGSDETAVIVINPPEVFDESFLRKLKSLHDDLAKEVPYVREIHSLINARRTKGEEDFLIVDELLSGWPEKHRDLDAIRNEVMNNPILINHLISEDGQYVAVILETEAPSSESRPEDEIIADFQNAPSSEDTRRGQDADGQRFLADEQISQIATAINNVTARYERNDCPIYLSGSPIVNDLSNRTLITDGAILFFIDVFLICLLPMLLFRRASGVLFPTLILMTSVMTTMGIMALYDVPFTAVTITVPSFLIVVGVGDSIHILAIFYRNLNQGYGKEDAISHAIGHSGAAILMTTVTTAAGMASFALSELAAFVHIGIFGPIGAFLAFLYTIVMLPALIGLFPIREKSSGDAQFALMDHVLLSFAGFSMRHSWRIVVVSLVIGSISVLYVFQIRFSHFPLSWFPDDMVIKKDTELIDEKLKGGVLLEAVIDTQKENGLYEPKVLNAIEAFREETERIQNSDIFVGKLTSVGDILRETNQALNENDPSHYSIPQDPEIIAQELFLFENSGSDDLERVVDASFSKSRITIKTKWADGIAYDEFVAEAEERLETLFRGEADVVMTGTMALVARAFSAALDTMARSYVACFSVVCVMMIILAGQLRIGLVSMVPNLLPILFVMGIIGFVDVPLDVNTMMVCSIALGVIVDDTVHFIYNFQKYYDQTGNASAAIRETFLGTGRAILVTSIILSLAYFAGELCTMKNIGRFGFFTGLVIAFALIADFVLTPALMFLISKRATRTA
jgi:predicted RND superfamily exporter protein